MRRDLPSLLQNAVAILLLLAGMVWMYQVSR